MVRARWAKMSRMSAVRSMTRSPVDTPRFRSWMGDSGSSGDHQVGALALRQGLHLVDLAAAEVEAGARHLALLGQPADDARSRRLREAPELVERLLHVGPALVGQPQGGQDRSLVSAHSISPSSTSAERRSRHRIQAPRAIHVDPAHVGLPPEPRHLPPRIARRVPPHEPLGLLEREPPRAPPRKLPVADPGHARRRLVHAPGEERAHLLQHPTGDHVAHPLAEPPLEPSRSWQRPIVRARQGGTARDQSPWPSSRRRAARALARLQRPHQADPVVRVQPRRRRGVRRRQARVKGRGALSGRRAPRAPAGTPDRRAEPGAARAGAPARRARCRPRRPAVGRASGSPSWRRAPGAEARGVVAVVRVGHVQQVVRQRRALFGRGLAGPMSMPRYTWRESALIASSATRAARAPRPRSCRRRSGPRAPAGAARSPRAAARGESLAATGGS